MSDYKKIIPIKVPDGYEYVDIQRDSDGKDKAYFKVVGRERPHFIGIPLPYKVGDIIECEFCGGSGRVDDCTSIVSKQCPKCKGLKKRVTDVRVVREVCGICKDRGYVIKHDKLFDFSRHDCKCKGKDKYNFEVKGVWV